MARTLFLLGCGLVLSGLLGPTNAANTTSSTTSAGTTTSTGTSASTTTTTSHRSVFTIPASADWGQDVLPNIEDPKAVNAQDVCPGYTASQVQEDDRGLKAVLTLAGKPCNVYGTDIETLSLTIEYQSSTRLAVNIQPAYLDASNSSQWLVPEDLIPRPKAEDSYKSLNLKFEWGNEPSFWFSVARKSSSDIIFTTQGTRLVYENQFVEFVNSLPQDYNLYGLGERMHGLRLNNDFTATIYAADVGDPIDRNIYGSHPFYLETRYFESDIHAAETDNSLKSSELHQQMIGNDDANVRRQSGNGSRYTSVSHGVYYRNTHGMDVVLKPTKLTWRSLGGVIDLFFFDGPTQPEVTKQYQESAIGLPAMQSYWTFGYHQCRWGYHNWTELRGIVESMKAFNIPLETIWLDIDYMRQYRDFTLDPKNFAPSNATEFLNWLHENDQHFVPIVDGAIYIPNPTNPDDAYDTYQRGNDSGVFLKNPDGSQYIGAVWPGYTVFPDWLSANAVSWWTKEMTEFHKLAAFSGIWLDMTEVSSFCVGSCGSGNVTLNPVHPPFSLPGEYGAMVYGYPEGFDITNATEAASASAANYSQAAYTEAMKPSSTAPTYLRTTPTPDVRNVNHPPYVINHVQGDLAVHAVSPNATHVNGVQEYDIHNVWGHQIINATYHALQSIFPGKRPFIIGRSTFAGSGKWAGHWGGDNASKWYYMYFSIPQALSFSLFGIPMFGVDTCGFNDNTDAELCGRWMQLSAFFPFYRNHNGLAGLSQEPFRWESVANASRTAMHIRYTLLPYMYTLFNQAHLNGSTVMRALAWEFPNEPQLAGVDNQFLLGPSIMVTPVLEPQAVTVNGVFPGVIDGASWYDWYTLKRVDAVAGANTTIPAPLGHIPVFIRGGSVLPIQEPGYTTTESRKNPWGLIVALSDDGTAAGSLYVDDGESLVPFDTLDVAFAVAQGQLKVDVRGAYKDSNALANVTVLGMTGGVGQVKFNGNTIDADKVNFDSDTSVLKLTGLNSLTSGGAWQSSWTLSWK
jgi:alpha-glucosidase